MPSYRGVASPENLMSGAFSLDAIIIHCLGMVKPISGVSFTPATGVITFTINPALSAEEAAHLGLTVV